MEPPIAERRPYKVSIGNVANENRGTNIDKLIDPVIFHDDDLYWLRDDSRENEEILSLLRKENEYYEYKTNHLKDSIDKLYIEIKSRILESDNTIPYKKGNYYYYTKTIEGSSYPYHCRCLYNSITKSLDNNHMIYLDENEIADNHEMCDIHQVNISNDHNIVAYSVDFSGSEEYDIAFKNLLTNEMFNDKISNTNGVIVWNKESTSIFYCTLDEHHRPFRVFKHSLGTDTSHDICIFEELDEKSWIHITSSNSDDYLIIRSSTKLTSFVCLHPLSERALRIAEKSDANMSILTSPLHIKRKSNENIKDNNNNDNNNNNEIPLIRLLNLPKVENVLYEVDHYRNNEDDDNDIFLILTNANDAKNFKICWCFSTNANISEWRDIIPSSQYIYFTGIEVHSTYIAISGSENGYQNIWVAKTNDLLENIKSYSDISKKLDLYRIPARDEVFVLNIDVNNEYETNSLRFTYSSPICPDMVCELQLIENVNSIFKIDIDYIIDRDNAWKIDVLKQRQVPNINLNDYETARLMAPTDDGNLIPISILYRKSALKLREATSNILEASPFEPAPLLLSAIHISRHFSGALSGRKVLSDL